MSGSATDSPIGEVFELEFVWKTFDPFLFCVHHDDAYPAGTDDLGPPTTDLIGRSIGQDFSGQSGWSMYHGSGVPGFPRHPHRGFETVSYVRGGLMDHADSMGAGARFGAGDVQWITAGRGIQHSEMFPLVDSSRPNPVELFQIWLNLPGEDKMAEPSFHMHWNEQIPRLSFDDANGRPTRVVAVAGRIGSADPMSPPPSSWASRSDSDVAIWHIEMDPQAEWTLPPAATGTARTIYVFDGEGIEVGGDVVTSGHGATVDVDQPVLLTALDGGAHVLVLQGRPIGEPVAHVGPFVMNTRAELEQAFLDYRQTGFGDWPWPSDDPDHGPTSARFAVYPDGSRDDPA